MSSRMNEAQNKTPDWRRWRSWLMLRPWQRHGLVLAVSGIVYMSLGITIRAVEDISFRQQALLEIALELVPLNSWAWIFIITGFLSILSSRWPPFAETWGYMLLSGLSSAISAAYVLGFLLLDTKQVSVFYGVIWGLVAFLWWAISGLVNPGLPIGRDRRGTNSD